MGKLIQVLSTAVLSVIGGIIAIVNLETGFLAFMNTPSDPTAYIPCVSFLFAALMAYMSVKAHMNKDTAYIKKTVDDIKEQTVENRVIVQGEAAKTRETIKQEVAKAVAEITAKGQASGQSLTEPEIIDLEQTITKILDSKDARQNLAKDALKAGNIDEAASRFMGLGNQEGAASDDIGKSAAENFHIAGELYYPFDTKKSLKAYVQAAKYDPNNFWTHIYLSRLYIRNGNLPNAVQSAQTAQAVAKNDRDKTVAMDEQGNIAVAQNDLKAARQYFTDGLEIRGKLAEDDPSNAGYQRDLSVSYNKLGDVAVAQNDLKAARQYFTDGLEIGGKLADTDPSNAGYQRDVGVSHYKLAGLGGKDAQEHWNAAYLVFKALDDAGKLLPADQKGLEFLRGKADVD